MQGRRLTMLAAATIGLAALAAPTIAEAATPSATTGVLSVMLTDPEKQPLAMDGVTLSLRTPAGATTTVPSVRTNTSGRATFPAVPAGTTWTLHGEREGEYGFADTLPEDRSGVSVAAGAHDTVVLVMRRGASIGGRASNPSGADLSGAGVVVRGWNTGTVKRTVTGADGHYWVHGLPSDDYSVQVNEHDESLPSWPALKSYTWGFHHDPGSSAERTYVRVSNQAGGRTETVTDHIDASVAEGPTLTGIVNPQLDTDFTNAVVHVYGEQIGSTFDTHMISWSPNRGGLLGTVLSPGRYKFEIVAWSPSQARYVSYWYAGEGNRPVATRAAAHTVIMRDYPLSINWHSTR